MAEVSASLLAHTIGTLVEHILPVPSATLRAARVPILPAAGAVLGVRPVGNCSEAGRDPLPPEGYSVVKHGSVPAAKACNVISDARCSKSQTQRGSMQGALCEYCKPINASIIDSSQFPLQPDPSYMSGIVVFNSIAENRSCSAFDHPLSTVNEQLGSLCEVHG